METRVEHHAPRISTMNAKPTMFQAGLSNKFTKRHITNFHDSTLTAASAAKARSELKMERQATAIEKQQQKIEQEMRKIEAITEKLQRQQAREAKRLRNRLVYAATHIQLAFRSHALHQRHLRRAAAVTIQRIWRGTCGRRHAHAIALEKKRLLEEYAACIITRTVRVFVCRLARQHEIQWRAYAATTIQSAVRRHHARRELTARRVARDKLERHQRAALVIQSHARGFLTRLVYMDVLHLVCRIQSVARGFLVRKRLGWLLSLNLHGIVELQALARGFLVRRRVRSLRLSRQEDAQDVAILDSNEKQPLEACTQYTFKPRLRVARDAVPCRAIAQPRSIRLTPHSPSRQATYALASMASMKAPPSASPPQMKRSYWLPLGASTTTTMSRPAQQWLPQLPASNRLLLPSWGSPSSTYAFREKMSVENVASHANTIQRTIRGRLTKLRPPLRLEPLVLRHDGEDGKMQQAGNSTDVETAKLKAAEERREREGILMRKRMARKLQDKERADQELAIHQYREKEDAEQKLMEREEKLVRLWLKTAQRKQHELKRRKQTLEQQREEKEQMEMLREERLMRLYRKRLHRLAHRASLHGRRQVTSLESLVSSGSNDGSPITKDHRDEDVHVMASEKARLRPQRIVHPTVPVRHNKPFNQRGNVGAIKPSSVVQKKTRQLRAVYGGAGGSNQVLDTRDDSSGLLQTQYASWNFHTDDLAKHAQLVEDDAEFDYGNDFDDVVEESQLSRLLC